MLYAQKIYQTANGAYIGNSIHRTDFVEMYVIHRLAMYRGLRLSNRTIGRQGTLSGTLRHVERVYYRVHVRRVHVAVVMPMVLVMMLFLMPFFDPVKRYVYTIAAYPVGFYLFKLKLQLGDAEGIELSDRFTFIVCQCKKGCRQHISGYSEGGINKQLFH